MMGTLGTPLLLASASLCCVVGAHGIKMCEFLVATVTWCVRSIPGPLKRDHPMRFRKTNWLLREKNSGSMGGTMLIPDSLSMMSTTTSAYCTCSLLAQMSRIPSSSQVKKRNERTACIFQVLLLRHFGYRDILL
jgi:hypothetical protein